MSFSLRRRVALVTGAGRGIGAAIAKRLAVAGAKVFLADREPSRVDEVSKAIYAGGGDAEILVFDVCDPAEWKSAVATIEVSAGRLDVLVNNVGVSVAKSLEETSLEDWRLLMTVNLEAPFIGIKTALPLMKATAQSTPFGGSIINVCSLSGIVGTPNLSAYAATKGGLRYFSKSAALEFARLGYRLRINTIHPGLIEGASADILFESSLRDDTFKTLEESKDFWIGRYPVNRMGRQEDVANGVLFLASDEANYMTGAELVIDGGFSAQ